MGVEGCLVGEGRGGGAEDGGALGAGVRGGGGIGGRGGVVEVGVWVGI